MPELVTRIAFDPKNNNRVFTMYNPISANGTDEYNQVVASGNYIDVDRDTWALCVEKQMCVIDGILQEYVKSEEENIQELKLAKKNKIMQLCTQAYKANSIVIVEFIFNGKKDILTFSTRATATEGITRQLYKIEHCESFSAIVDPLIPGVYRGIARMFWAYVEEFSVDYKVNSIIFKQSKRQELITFFKQKLFEISTQYVDNPLFYISYMYDRLLNGDAIKALETIEKVNAYTYTPSPLKITIPEEYIENVIYNDW